MANSRNRTAAAASRASGQSARVGRAAPRARAATSSNTALWVGVAAAAIAVVVIIAISTSGTGAAASGGRDPAADSQTEPASAATPAPAKSATPAASDAASASFAARPGKPPTTAAPAIPADVFARAEAHYEAAKAKWNEGQIGRRSAEHETYTTALKDAFEELESFRTVTEKYTDWFNEADLEGWAMPAEYARLGNLLTKFDTLRSKVQKLKTR